MLNVSHRLVVYQLSIRERELKYNLKIWRLIKQVLTRFLINDGVLIIDLSCLFFPSVSFTLNIQSGIQAIQLSSFDAPTYPLILRHTL